MRIILVLLIVGLLGNVTAQENKVWTLKECVDYALENNISVKQSELDKSIAEEDVKAAKWNFAPNLNASVGQSFSFGSAIGVSGVRIPQDFRSNDFGVSSSINLFNGFTNLQTYKQSKIGVEAQKAAIAKMKNDISLNVVNAYLQILFAKEQLKVAESQLAISSSEVKRAETLVEAGVLPQGDLLNIKSTQANDSQSLIVAQNTVAIAQLSLAQLLQLDATVIDVADVLVDIKDQEILGNDANVIYKKAVAVFPEIKLAELNIKSAEKSVQLARAGFYPSLGLSFGLNTAYQHRQGFPDVSPFLFSEQIDNNLGQSVRFSLNIPIFNRMQIRAGVNKAKINYQKVAYNLESEKLRLQQTIQTAYTDALASSKSYDAATVAEGSQQKAFEYSQERFAVGAVNSFDFNQAKNNLVNAQAKLIQSKYDFIFKLKVLEFYYGMPFVGK